MEGIFFKFLDIGEPSKKPEIASDEWIDTILPKEVSFENSQILSNNSVFGAWVSSRSQKLAKAPEQQYRSVDRGGRSDKFPWDDFWVEACRVANTPDGLPEQREFNKSMLEWVSRTWPDPPADSTVRAR